MHSKLDDEWLRQEKRLTDSIFQAPAIRSLTDIKRVLSILDPRRATDRDVTIATELHGETDSGSVARFAVRSRSESQSQRSLLLNAFAIMKRRLQAEERISNNIVPIEVNGKEMRPAPNRAASQFVALDNILERWLGAKRSGLFIYWDLSDGRYLYDIFEHRLFKDNNVVETPNG